MLKKTEARWEGLMIRENGLELEPVTNIYPGNHVPLIGKLSEE